MSNKLYIMTLTRMYFVSTVFRKQDETRESQKNSKYHTPEALHTNVWGWGHQHEQTSKEENALTLTS